MKNFWNLHRANFNLRPLHVILLLLLTTLLVSHGCRKEPSSIGLNLRDRDNLLNATFTDTTTLTAYSVVYSDSDTMNTTNLRSSYLGYVKDPVFGTTTACIYAQFIPSSTVVNFGASRELDSIVLILRYSGGWYGDTLNPIRIKVYELEESLSTSTTYNKNSSVAYSSEEITYYPNIHMRFAPNTRIRIDSLLAPHIRIRLKNELGNRFLADSSTMRSFKGLYICAEAFQNNGSLVNFALTDPLTSIQLYYKNDSTSNQFKLTVPTTAVRFNTYQHDHKMGNTEFVNQVIYKDTLLGEKKLYAQGFGGVQTKITFPHLKALREKKMVVNKAELVITNIGEDLSVYPPPTRLTIRGVNPSGRFVFLPDDVDDTYFGGRYDETNKEYRFRITRYIQDIILRDRFEPFIYLVVRDAPINPHRLLFKGTDTLESPRLRLELYYTEY
ncbi:MAG: DUF4270 domain-containing protein [Lentimicrobiaceae bacterium]|nr:DUF4270 domain-containing protein [Lentimicrobiaceae bacterium]